MHQVSFSLAFSKTRLNDQHDQVEWLESNPRPVDSALVAISDSTHIPQASYSCLSAIWTQVMTSISYGALEQIKGSNNNCLTLRETAFLHCSPKAVLPLALH